MLLAILNAVAIVSMATAIIFFIIAYCGFRCKGYDARVDQVYDQIEEMMSAILDADKTVLLKALARWVIFPPMLLAMLAAFAAYIITRRCE